MSGQVLEALLQWRTGAIAEDQLQIGVIKMRISLRLRAPTGEPPRRSNRCSHARPNQWPATSRT